MKPAAYITENKLFAIRLRKVMKERGESQTSLADTISKNHQSLQRQTIAYYMSGQRVPDAERLAWICEALEVSSDYLIGLSNCSTTDADMQSISFSTGLSDEALKKLMDLREDRIKMKCLNGLIQCERFQDLLLSISSYRGEVSSLASSLREAEEYLNSNLPINKARVEELKINLEMGAKYIQYHLLWSGKMLSDILEQEYPYDDVLVSAEETLKKLNYLQPNAQ